MTASAAKILAVCFAVTAATGALACDKADIEGDWFLSGKDSDLRCHLSIAPVSARIVCISAVAGTESMIGDITIVDGNNCIIAGHFFRGDYERLTFMTGKQTEGHILYGDKPYAVSFARP